MALEDSGSVSFQKLLFLIRDCPFADEVSGCIWHYVQTS